MAVCCRVLQCVAVIPCHGLYKSEDKGWGNVGGRRKERGRERIEGRGRYRGGRDTDGGESQRVRK